MNVIEFLRQFRVGGYAIFDLVVAFGGMYLLAPLLSRLFKKIRIIVPRLNRVFLTLPIAVIVHFLVGNITPMTKDIVDIHGHYLIKIIILVSLFFGIRKIKILKKST
ncbi:hypothetical protein P148_SR1C00001G0253 [candidate division SR1 bacterium RAAC1_SR1_1]|nr:hypothetical protein P148_SR1C00001G0253 [candidate division SR1 bacterium RAAC1_SR1_1]